MYCAWRIPAHLRCTQCSILLHLIDICFLICICLWQISQIQTFLFIVVGLVSTSPDFVSNSASHPAGPHGRHAQKTVNQAPIAGVGEVRHNLHSSLSSKLLSALYLARCLERGNVCHPITTRATPERQMKETLYTRHRNTVEPMMVKNDRKATLQALHTTAVVKAVQCHERKVVLDGGPPPISNSEKELTRKERSTVPQLRSGYCRLLVYYKSRIKKDASLDVCADCATTPHVKHLFVCPAHTTTLKPADLWSRPTDAVRELSYLETRDPD